MSFQNTDISARKDSNVRKRRSSFYLLVFAAITLISVCHFQWKQPLAFLIQLFGYPEFMIAVVSGVIVMGVVMCCCSLIRINKEQQLLSDKLLTSLYEQCGTQEEERDHAQERLRNCKARLEQLCEKENHVSLAWQRLDIIFRSLNEFPGEDKRHRVLPELNDLHDISLHTELSRKDSAWVSTILSFLLVLGIFGTLTGVHAFLGHGSRISENLPDLALALLPSAFAVLGTIVLICLRSAYLRRVQFCISRLDELTMSVIIPVLFEVQHGISTQQNTLEVAIDQLPDIPDEQPTGETSVSRFNAEDEEMRGLVARVDTICSPNAQSEVSLFEITEKTDVSQLQQLKCKNPPRQVDASRLNNRLDEVDALLNHIKGNTI